MLRILNEFILLFSILLVSSTYSVSLNINTLNSLAGQNEAIEEVPPSSKLNGKVGIFWQLTDVHWDLRYSQFGDKQQMCHEYSDNNTTGYYGNYLCDSPWNLVQSALHAMFEIQPKPDFILWTGDNAPHSRDPKPDFDVIFKTIQNLTNEISNIFGTEVPLIPVLGNHDTFPQDNYPTSSKEFYSKYLKLGGWESVIPSKAQRDFERGGYFVQDIGSNLKVISMNTNLYYKFNKLGTDETDPADQFAFLERTLKSAREDGQKVIVGAHAPPGYWERNATMPFLNDTYNDRLVDIMVEFGDVILAQIYGHEHTDSFRIFGTSHENLTGVAFLAPSLTPWFARFLLNGTAINPSLRLYSYDNDSIIDYYQHHMNLTEANAANQSDNFSYMDKCSSTDLQNETCSMTNSKKNSSWKLYYIASEMYNVSRLNTSNMALAYSRLYSNDTLFQQYYLYNSAGFDDRYCGDICKHHHICAISHIKIDSLVKCIDVSTYSSHSHSNLDLHHSSVTKSSCVNATCNESRSHFVLAIGVGLLSMAIILSAMITVIIVRKRKLISGSQVPLPNFEWMHRSSHVGYRPLSVSAD